MNVDGQERSRSTFEIRPEIYDGALNAAVARWPILAAYERFPITICKYQGMVQRVSAITYVTKGLGVFPLFDSELEGYVSRELAISISSGSRDGDVLAFIDFVVNSLLDAKEAPGIGTCFGWPDALAELAPASKLEYLYVGHAFLAPEVRQFSAPGAPRTRIMELVPLTSREVDALEKISESVPDFFKNAGLDPTRLDR